MHVSPAWPLAYLRELGVPSHSSRIDKFLHQERSSWAANGGLLLAVREAKLKLHAFPVRHWELRGLVRVALVRGARVHGPWHYDVLMGVVAGML